MAYCDGERVQHFEQTYKGYITDTPRGKRGNSIEQVVCLYSDATLAEMRTAKGGASADVDLGHWRQLGCVLERELDGRILRGRITEVEAYDQTDAASHSYRGKTERTAVMFGPAGYLYVYFTYGMHYCCNIVVGEKGYGAAVLIRAIEPLGGEDVMLANRHGRGGAELSNGPAKLCQAFGIDKRLNGHDLRTAPLRLIPADPTPPQHIIATPRIGISQAKDVLWRFMLTEESKTQSSISNYLLICIFVL